VLVVDDSRVVLSIAKRALQNNGFKVSTRSSMEEAIEGVAALNVDCVVTDIFMPGMGGIEGVMMLRKLHPGLALVAMSGGLDGQMEANASLTAASKIGAGATLQKPFSDQKLVDAVQAAIAARARTAA
jgi:CheY-like chemotaxis protein